MTAKEIREVVVGGVAVVVLGFAIAGSYGGQAVEAETGFDQYRLFANFNRIDGLRVGDEVFVSGVRVGAVDQVALDVAYRAQVTLRIDSSVRLPTDSAVAIHTDGLFGSKFVSLLPGIEEKTLRGGDSLSYTQDSLIVSELLDLIIAQGKSVRRGTGKAER
jgi:phospholipid/cholesterol/gamma-HCH transport system substrate-binding protein